MSFSITDKSYGEFFTNFDEVDDEYYSFNDVEKIQAPAKPERDFLIAAAEGVGIVDYFSYLLMGNGRFTADKSNRDFGSFRFNSHLDALAGYPGDINMTAAEAGIIDDMNVRYVAKSVKNGDVLINQPIEHTNNQLYAVGRCDELLADNNYREFPFLLASPPSADESRAREQACVAAASGAFTAKSFGVDTAQTLLKARTLPYSFFDRSIYEFNYQAGQRYAQTHPELPRDQLPSAIMNFADLVYRSVEGHTLPLPRVALKK
jgi:hypothetical protein